MPHLFFSFYSTPCRLRLVVPVAPLLRPCGGRQRPHSPQPGDILSGTVVRDSFFCSFDPIYEDQKIFLVLVNNSPRNA
jgi:hypothetical protein